MKNKIKFKNIMYITIISLYSYVFFLAPVGVQAAGIPKELVKAMGNLWNEYWFYIAVFIAFGVLSGILAFIVLFMRLGANSTNPQERSRIMKEMIAVAICTALLGAFTFITTLYMALFN